MVVIEPMMMMASKHNHHQAVKPFFSWWWWRLIIIWLSILAISFTLIFSFGFLFAKKKCSTMSVNFKMTLIDLKKVRFNLKRCRLIGVWFYVVLKEKNLVTTKLVFMWRKKKHLSYFDWSGNPFWLEFIGKKIKWEKNNNHSKSHQSNLTQLWITGIVMAINLTSLNYELQA